MDYTLNNGACNINKRGCNCKNKQKLGTFDWLCDLPETQKDTDFVEVQFKNTRKGYYLNSIKLPLEKGYIIAVESSPGHDIGEVTLTGRLVLLQMKKNNFNPERTETKRVYRKAKETDIEKFNEAKAKEQETMIKARQIAESMKLNMKIGDVEFQGDGNKAIFYYIADERVDFRQLIKVFAETFRVRIEMKQIGARQEAGRIGGIGPCGRELCCSGWMTSFNSVSTNAARYQDISLNPQKLAGQCAKLKCCMNFELDAYMDASKEFPSKELQLETMDNVYYHFKTDVFKGLISYSTAQNFGANVVTVSSQRAKEVVALNKKGIKPDTLDVKIDEKENQGKTEYDNVVGEDSLTRFDTQKKRSGSAGKSSQKQKSNNNSNDQSDPARNGQRPPLIIKKNIIDNSKNEA
ncbi:MAG: regulatory iron-sulfur-containing complex subunit RicT [Paludibacter sp.]|nr:regulatory iron-sulfur-containing complex subunit RicT [Paludibacter sp.]